MFDVIIIGCGVVGAATAYELSKYKLKIAVLESENDVATGTSKANSAIIHAGYDPEPGTLMAKLNVRGNALAAQICEKLDVPFKRVGSLVLAFNANELEHINSIYKRGLENGVPSMKLLSADEVKKIEPNVSENVLGALLAPSAGIINPWDFTLAMAEAAAVNGTEIHLNSPVTSITKSENGFVLKTAQNAVFEAKYVINAAGIHGGAVHTLIGGGDYSISPVRGQYYLLDKAQGNLVNHVVFQCPTAAGKGVLVSPTVHGNLIVGPNFEPIECESKATTVQGLDYVMASSKKSVPSINFRDNIRNFAGLRACADRDDFIIEESPAAKGFFNLVGIKSPGLSAAPAIGEAAAELLKNAGASLERREDYQDKRAVLRFNELSDSEKQRLIEQDPRFGRVICRCETITEGEIVNALHSPIPAVSIAGVKRRCNAGMGRCQGGFCSPRVCEIIARELNISLLEVEEDCKGSFVLTGKTKGEDCDNV
ncbi:MAG: NAD(P)/FAD-dependent oxidoreductase [Oscillospiraceae bacterium]